MRSYTINLPRGLEVDIFNLPENFDEAVRKAKEVVMCEVKKIRVDACKFYSDNNIEFDRY